MLASIAAAVLMPAAMPPMLLAPGTAAHAVTDGPGFFLEEVNFLTFEWGFVGGHLHPAGVVYCLEMPVPSNVQENPELNPATVLPSFTYHSVHAAETQGDAVRWMADILSRYGETSDNTQAAAVQIAVWELRRADGNRDYGEMLDAVRAALPGEATARADEMVAEAQNRGALPGPVAQPEIRSHGGYRGEVLVHAGTTSLTISNGVFVGEWADETSIEWAGGLAQPTTIVWEGRPPTHLESWDRRYRVSFDGGYRYETRWTEVAYGCPREGQCTGKHGGEAPRTIEGEFEQSYIEPDTLWKPTLSTSVPSLFVAQGEAFADTVTFDVAEGSEPWRSGQSERGQRIYAPILAQGTLYGPFLSDPKLNPSETPPAGAPIAATAEVRTDVARGPGTYDVRAGSAREAGYYSWVWAIDFDDQEVSLRLPVSGEPSIPDGYRFADHFGAAHEGQIVPTDLRFVTNLSSSTVPLGGQLSDEVTVLPGSGWLQGDDGQRLPFVLRGAVYLTEEQPVRQADPSADAELLTRDLTVTVNQPGEVLNSDIFSIPVTSKKRWVTVQWCVLDEDQSPEARGMAAEYCDDFGVPSETAEIVYPIVTTEAQSAAIVGEKIADVARVSGPIASLPHLSYELTWQAYHRGSGVTEEPDEALCTPETLVWQSAEPTTVERTGDYTSASWRVGEEHVGEILWVETLWVVAHDEDEATRVVVHRGRCGESQEITRVHLPPRLAVTGDTEAADLLVVAGLGAVGIGSVLVVMGGAMWVIRRHNTIDLMAK